jgi:hypothetical protein
MTKNCFHVSNNKKFARLRPMRFNRLNSVDFEFTTFYFHSIILDSQYIIYDNSVRIPD